MRPTLLLLLTVTVAVYAKKENTLVLVHALFRHGNRTPDNSSEFPTDQYVEKNYDPYGYGQLTRKGKQTENKIGTWMRDNYGDLIPSQYTPNVVYALTTNFKRTKMSLELVLAGLFPTKLFGERYNELVDWQPIPYNIEQVARNPLLAFSNKCPAFTTHYYQYLISNQAQLTISPYKDLYKDISELSGRKIAKPADISNIYFTLKSEDDYGFKLPEWSKNYYPERLEEASSVEYEMLTGNDKLKKLGPGFLLKKILADTKQLIDGTLPADRKVFLYSAHEVNVGTMLRTLNVFYRHVPPFGATIFFEIHKIDGVYGLKLRYEDYKEAQPRLLTIPGCGSFCPMDLLESLVKNQLPGDADQCHDNKEH